MRLLSDEKEINLEINNHSIQVDKNISMAFKLNRISDNKANIILNNKVYKATYFKSKDSIFVNLEGKNYKYHLVEDDDRFEKVAQDLDEAEIKPPMPGSVVQVIVSEGDNVKVGDSLIIVEAMKMETTLYSPIDGIVESVFVKEKDQLTGEEVLLIVKKIKV